MDGKLVAVLDSAPNLVEIREVDLRVDSLTEEVHPQRHEADVPGPFAIAEEAALDPVGAGEVAQLGCGYTGSAVVVRVQRQHDGLTGVQVPGHPLDRVGIDVGGDHLDSRRQVDDHLVVGPGVEDLDDLVADPGREVLLGAGVGLR